VLTLAAEGAVQQLAVVVPSACVLGHLCSVIPVWTYISRPFRQTQGPVRRNPLFIRDLSRTASGFAIGLAGPGTPGIPGSFPNLRPGSQAARVCRAAYLQARRRPPQWGS
jgi:hypothetical protein